MSVSDWFVKEPDAGGLDDLGGGTVIDLHASEAALTAQVGDLLRREGRLWDTGIRCQIKQEQDGTCCNVCPLSHHDDPGDDLYALCRIGRAQEQTLTQLAVLRYGDRNG